MHVLIVKTSSMGDVIHTLPALTDAVRQLPEVTFDWVVEEAFAEIPEWHSAVGTVIPVAIRRWRKSVLSRTHWREMKSMIGYLRSRQYDYVIDAQGLIKSALLTRLALGHRCGLSYSSCRESLATLAYQQKYPVCKNQHAIDRIRQLFELSLNYAGRQENIDYDLTRFQWTGRGHAERFLVFVHSASRADKLWPLHYWVDLARTASQQGYHVKLLWGNEIEHQRSRLIANNVVGCQVLPRMTLTSIARLLQQSTAMVGVDTGLSHLAAAIGVPAVTLYVNTSPDLIGTRGRNQYHLSTIKCNGILESEISVEQVWTKIMSATLNSKI